MNVHPTRPQPKTLKPIEGWDGLTKSVIEERMLKGLIDDKWGRMSLTWDDYVTLIENSAETMEYLESIEVLLCAYRKELKEKECEDNGY